MAAATGAILGGLALASSTAGFFEQKKAGREAERKQQKAQDVSQASAQVENARRRRRAIAQQRIAAAQNTANMSGAVSSSSALTGTNASLGAQTGANIGAQRAQLASQTQIGNLNQSAATTLRQGSERAGMFDLGSQFLTMGAQAFAGSGAGGGGKPSSGARSSVNTGGFNPGNNMYDSRTGFTGVGL